uniref:Transposase n=1 Tax=Ascaris lumbricoides TaxID=6252 RepID=A0A0M3I700_ASCLU
MLPMGAINADTSYAGNNNLPRKLFVPLTDGATCTSRVEAPSPNVEHPKRPRNKTPARCPRSGKCKESGWVDG